MSDQPQLKQTLSDFIDTSGLVRAVCEAAQQWYDNTDGGQQELLDVLTATIKAKVGPDSPHTAPAVLPDLLAMVTLLENGEWAEHVATSDLGQRLEAQITKLYNAQTGAAATQLDFAKQQLTGYTIGKSNNADDLVSSMGLTLEEWQQIKTECQWLDDSTVRDIDDALGQLDAEED